ncbi:MAG: flagellar protein FlgN [Gammaproteobacteria bacterium]|nr:flagellar protein FlgN [Gammaproteobacteria bacterium]
MDTARALLETLTLEHHELVHGDAQKINTVSERKLEQMKQLQRLSSERNRHLSQHETASGSQCIEGMLGAIDDDDRVHENWRELKELVLNLRESNEINGSIVAHEQRQVQQALHLLTGRTRDNLTYGPAGDTYSNQQSQTLAMV